MTSHELANHLLMQPDLPDCVCVKRSEVAESDHLYAIDQLTQANAALEAENRALREALSKFFDQADEENFAPTKDCFVHCEGCDPSFDCWRPSDGCRKTLAPKEGNAP